MELSQNFYESMKECVNIRSKNLARGLHCQLITKGLGVSTFVQNNLINMYASCGLIDDASLVFDEIELKNVFSWNAMIEVLVNSGRIMGAQKVFDEMPQRDVVSWNSMMSGYFRNGLIEKTVEVFVLMVRCFECVPDAYSFTCVMKACASLGNLNLALQVHGLAQKFEFLGDNSVESSMVDMYIKCGKPDIAEQIFLKISNPSSFSWNSMIYGYSKLYGAQRALELFDDMPKRDVVSWNMIVSILSKHGNVMKTLSMFIEMCRQGFKPNSMTYASVLSACTSIYELTWGTHLHGRIIRIQQDVDVYVGTSLIDMYAKCGLYVKARQVFNNLKHHNIVTWTSLIGGAVHCSNEEEAIKLFKQMKTVPVASDHLTLATVLNACCNLKDIDLGTQIHAYSFRIGMNTLTPVANALITMYAKCSDIQSANNVFQQMSFRDIISWTTMISSFSQSGNVVKAREYFDKMPERNVVSWNSMLSGYVQCGFWEEGLKIYVLMSQQGVKPDWITFVCSINACANGAVLKLGNQVVAQAEKSGYGSDVSVKNSIVTMYSKCGRIKDAEKTFDLIVSKNLITWNAMMAGYAQSGQGDQVIETFEKMIRSGIRPDNISYVSVLSGCSHSGLLSEGQHYFNMLIEDQSINPTCEHFACMVDLFGRAGLVEKAKDIIENMRMKPNAAVWGALLGACRIHGDSTMAETALKNLVELDAEDSGSYVLLANLYSDSGNLENVSNVRRIMKDKGIRKDPGCSWIEVDNRVHVFTVDDANHPRIKDVYYTLDEIIRKLEETGMYVRKNSCVYHSEKLALAFGLLSLPGWMPIDIMKNLRICDDCHFVMKLVSRVTSRELIIRDANRFHYFKNGSCSCRDFW
ncbi:putative pentatricopeptide repeat-containing protein At3g11460, mitochondrial [Rutidosis leptorrhynchoides]|uniref:putative pentatricopeptide repeat-containing protein At3g11460, mitochondrial n=1 Tax=Rutidosis leptorrhynchoides TaxID=125765 RepID=UPI003A9937EE